MFVLIDMNIKRLDQQRFHGFNGYIKIIQTVRPLIHAVGRLRRAAGMMDPILEDGGIVPGRSLRSGLAQSSFGVDLRPS